MRREPERHAEVARRHLRHGGGRVREVAVDGAHPAAGELRRHHRALPLGVACRQHLDALDERRGAGLERRAIAGLGREHRAQHAVRVEREQLLQRERLGAAREPARDDGDHRTALVSSRACSAAVTSRAVRSGQSFFWFRNAVPVRRRIATARCHSSAGGRLP